MLAISVAMPLSLVGLFSVPTWPKIAPLVSVLLMLTTITLWMLSYWADKALIVPEGEAQRPRRWLWQYASVTPVYKRFYLRFAILFASLFYFQGAIWFIMQWWTSTRDWDGFTSGLAPLTAGVASYLIFAILWGRVGSRVDRALDRPFGATLVVLLVMVVLMLSFWLRFTQLGKLKVGQATPWAEQLARAHEVIANKYPNAMLAYLTASRDYDAPETYEASLQLAFFFDQPDGTSIQVRLRDTNPEASVKASEPYKSNDESDMYSAEEQEKLEAQEGAIRVSPRDALMSAVTDLRKDTPSTTSVADYTSLTLYLTGAKPGNSPTFKEFNRPSVWEVSLNFRGSIPDQTYWVDAQTGEILLHKKDQ